MAALAPSVPVAVIGAGTMGSGIALVAATAGHPVLLHDANAAAIDRGRASSGPASTAWSSAAGIDAAGARGAGWPGSPRRPSPRHARAGSAGDRGHRRGSGRQGVAARARWKLLLGPMRHRRHQHLLPVGDRTGGTAAAARAGRRHALLQPGAATAAGRGGERPSHLGRRSGRVAATARRWGKVPVHCRSTPGFIVNRVARPFYGEASAPCSARVPPTPATIDAVLCEAGGFRMGPFALMDLIGHDVNFAVTRSVYEGLFHDPRYRPSLLQKELVDAGRSAARAGAGSTTIATRRSSPSLRTARRPAPSRSWSKAISGRPRP